MLVTFRSKVGDITMFGDVGVSLLKMMGQSGGMPGAILAADISAAIASLRAALAQARPAENQTNDDGARPKNDSEDAEPPIALATRAKPLLDLLERAQRASADVTWSS